MTDARLKITAYSSQTDRIQQVRDIAAEVPTARIGQTWHYRGLIVEKHAHAKRSRSQSQVAVLTPSGDRLDQFAFDDLDSQDLVARLDACRQHWVTRS